MNNSCPSCGAIYNVAQKDIGRRLKCKKCGSSLVVTDAGLEAEMGPVASAPAAGPVRGPAADDDMYEDDAPPPRGRTSARRGGGGGGGGLALDPIQIFKDFGGVWSVLFGLGAFLVIVFLFQPLVGEAKVRSRTADIKAAQRDFEVRKKALEKDSKTAEITKLEESFEKRREELTDKVEAARISNAQGVYWERYFMMFGFILLMAGSLGYLMPGQPVVRRVVGGTVLTVEMILVFMYFLIRAGVSDVGS